MQVWPAIDLRRGRCVRLQQGDYDRETVFSDDPAAVARQWFLQGASCLHVVDLDGALHGQLSNRDAIAAIISASSGTCQLGGGVRDETTITTLLEMGLDRLVIGTRALKEPDWFRAMCRQYPHKLALAIDARGGRVATDGWQETSNIQATEFVGQFSPEPIGAIIYTDIARDGMMEGPNLDAMAQMNNAAAFPVIASGGVSTVEDVEKLGRLGLAGCIIGRALYEGSVDLRAALDVANDIN